MKEFIKKTEKESKKETKKAVVLLDTNSIAAAIADTTDGKCSQTLLDLLKRIEAAGLGSPDNRLSGLFESSEEHEKIYVQYGEEEGKPVSLEADVILVLRYKLGDINVGNLLHIAHNKVLNWYGYNLYKQYCGEKELDECLAIVWDAYLSFLLDYCIVTHGKVHMSTEPYVFKYVLALADRKDRALMSMPFALRVEVLQTLESTIKKLKQTETPIEKVSEEMLNRMMTAHDKKNVSAKNLLFLLHQKCVTVKKNHRGNYCDADGVGGYLDDSSELNQVRVDSPEEAAIRKDLYNIVKRVLTYLSEKDKRAVFMFADYIENEWTIKELAKKYNVSESTAFSMKNKGLKILKKELKEYAE